MTRGCRHGSVCRSLRESYLSIFFARRVSYLAECPLWVRSGHLASRRLHVSFGPTADVRLAGGGISSERRHQKKSA